MNQLREIFVLEERRQGGRWRHSSIYDPYGPLSHDFDRIEKLAKNGTIIKGLFDSNTEYRVIRFERTK